jgi:hypothetical protein
LQGFSFPGWALCYSAFCCCDKILEIDNLKRRKDSFSQFTVSEVSVHGHLTVVFGPVVRQSIMVEMVWWSKAVHLMMTKIPFKGTPSVTYFLQLGLTSTVYTTSQYKPINRFIHSVYPSVFLANDFFLKQLY